MNGKVTKISYEAGSSYTVSFLPPPGYMASAQIIFSEVLMVHWLVVFKLLLPVVWLQPRISPDMSMKFLIISIHISSITQSTLFISPSRWFSICWNTSGASSHTKRNSQSRIPTHRWAKQQVNRRLSTYFYLPLTIYVFISSYLSWTTLLLVCCWLSFSWFSLFNCKVHQYLCF